MTDVDVAVTGGAGFLGRHVVAALLARGHRVRVLDTAARPAAPYPWGLDDVSVSEWTSVDVATGDGLTAALAGATAVVHLAGLTSVAACRDNPLAALRANVLGTATVLDACEAVGVRRTVLASTRYAAEGATPRGAEVYATSKRMAEAWAALRRRPVLRLDNLYGPGQSQGAVVADFIARACRGERPYAGPAESVPLLFIDDAVEAVLAVLDGGEAGIYHARAPEGPSLRDVATVVEAVTRGQGASLPTRGGALEPDFRLASLGWRAKTAWPDGIARTWAAWRTRPAEVLVP